MNPLKKVDSVMKTRETEYVNNLTLNIVNVMSGLKNKTMPLDVYRQYFEPIFLGHIPLDETNRYLIDKFISYAGNPKASVDIVDENNNVVATIPGIYSRTPISFIEEIPYNFEQIKNAHSVQSLSVKGRMLNERMIEDVTSIISNKVIGEQYVSNLEELLKNDDHVSETDSFIIYED